MLVNSCPLYSGGDFNILQSNDDKNKPMSRSPYVDKFNSVINAMCLSEVYMSGGMYTWTNGQSHPTLEKLDRVLMSNDWEDIFPQVNIMKLVRDVSDHNALLLSSDNHVVRSPQTR